MKSQISFRLRISNLLPRFKNLKTSFAAAARLTITCGITCGVMCAVICAVTCGIASAASASLFGSKESTKISIPAAGGREAATVYLPIQYSNRQTWPVVMLLHGYVGSSTLIENYFGFSEYASARGFILIVPNGLKDHDGRKYWNATPGCCDFDHTGSNDSRYLSELLKQIVSVYHGDPSRIYLSGHSNGGFMSYRLACESELPIAAVASFAGAMFEHPSECKNKRAVSVVQMHALDDDTISYLGSSGYPGLSSYPAVSSTVSQWRARNGCDATVTSTDRLDLTLSISGTDTTAQVWSQCSAGTEVELWTIDAHKGALHFPHTPLLRNEFTVRVLDFLFRHQTAPAK